MEQNGDPTNPQDAMGRARDFLHRRHGRIAFIFIAVAFAVAQGPRVKDNYRALHPEDLAFIQHNARVIETLGDCFNQGAVFPGIYRPLTTNLYYFVGRKLFANRIEIHHIISIIFYLTNGFLLYLICLALLPRPWAALAAMIFVSRFSHVAVVTNTCEFQSLLSTFFCLVALKLFMASRARRELLFGGLSAIAFGLALFSKETVFVFPAMLLAYGWLLDRQFSWRRYLAPILVCGLLMLLYALALRATVPYKAAMITYDTSLSNVARNYSAYLLAFSNLLAHKSQGMGMPPAISGLAAARPMEAAFLILLAACLVFAAIQRKLKGKLVAPGRAFAFGVLFFAIATAPYAILNLRLFMRYSYFGHAGLAISSGIVLHEIATAVFRRGHPKA